MGWPQPKEYPVSCCRARKATATSPSANPCSRLEQAGAGYMVYPVVTSSSVLLATDVEQDGRKFRVDLGSLLTANKCNGATCRWLLGELPLIMEAARKKPEVIGRYSRSGLSISDLAKISRLIVRGGQL